MRRAAIAVILAIALPVGLPPPAAAQSPPVNVIVITPSRGPTPPPPVAHGITPLGGFVMGTIGCAAISPMIQSALLGRELTLNEAYRSTFGCVLGPLGWVLADALVPPTTPTPSRPKPPQRQTPGRAISVPPRGAGAYVPDEVLFQTAGASARSLANLAQRLHLTPIETHRFVLLDRTLHRWRITDNRSVTATLQRLARYRFVVAAQPNYLYRLEQQPTATNATASGGNGQYVVSKLRLIEAHRLSTGAEVRVAVIDSGIDSRHPDLVGAIAAQDDVVGGGTPHAHGTAMAGAIAAHSKLLGVAPKVRLLAVRAFSGTSDSADGTTFNILKGLDWAASERARIVNMSFAGPSDRLMREMVAKAHAHGMVLIAAVGNAGPHSPPLYPAAYHEVIGVTAVDADDKLLPQANRGSQVTLAAPGVDVLADAPDDSYQLTSGTSVATALTSGVAALMLARDPALTPDQLRRRLIASVRHIAGRKTEVGAGVIDALAAVQAAK